MKKYKAFVNGKRIVIKAENSEEAREKLLSLMPKANVGVRK